MSKVIDLEQRCQFRVLLHPVRQEIVRLLHLTRRPLTVSAVAKRLHLSPLTAKGHLEKLAELGMAEAQTETDGQGHRRTLYSLGDVELRLHLGRKDEFQGEREALAAKFADAVFRDMVNASHAYQEEELAEESLFFVGALHLTTRERKELAGLVADYLAAHRVPSPQTEESWEYTLMARRFREEAQG